MQHAPGHGTAQAEKAARLCGNRGRKACDVESRSCILPPDAIGYAYADLLIPSPCNHRGGSASEHFRPLGSAAVSLVSWYIMRVAAWDGRSFPLCTSCVSYHLVIATHWLTRATPPAGLPHDAAHLGLRPQMPPRESCLAPRAPVVTSQPSPARTDILHG